MKPNTPQYNDWIRDLKVGDPVILKGKYRPIGEKGKIRKVKTVESDGNVGVICKAPLRTAWSGENTWWFKGDGLFNSLDSGYYLHPPKCKACPTKQPKTCSESEARVRPGCVAMPGFITGGFIHPGRCKFEPIEEHRTLSDIAKIFMDAARAGKATFQELENRIREVKALEIEKPKPEPQLPPKGLDLKVDDWVELWNRSICILASTDLPNCSFRAALPEQINGRRCKCHINNAGFSTGSGNGSCEYNVKRLIPREEAPPYLEWLKTNIESGEPFNCKVVKGEQWHNQYTDPPNLISLGIFSSGGFTIYAPLVYPKNSGISTTKFTTKGTSNGDRFRLGPTDW